jgi:hypothetical protein
MKADVDAHLCWLGHITSCGAFEKSYYFSMNMNRFSVANEDGYVAAVNKKGSGLLGPVLKNTLIVLEDSGAPPCPSREQIITTNRYRSN